jgi:hypothetical protein
VRRGRVGMNAGVGSMSSVSRHPARPPLWEKGYRRRG